MSKVQIKWRRINGQLCRINLKCVEGNGHGVIKVIFSVALYVVKIGPSNGSGFLNTHTTCKTTLNMWLATRRGRYLHTSTMSSTGFEPTIPAIGGAAPTYALDLTSTESGVQCLITYHNLRRGIKETWLFLTKRNRCLYRDPHLSSKSEAWSPDPFAHDTPCGSVVSIYV
jgi:hypothetical protein